MRLDSVVRSGWRRRAAFPSKYSAISDAAFELGQARVGALIVLVRGDSIAELMQDGTKLGAEISRELIAAIFQKASPLHDGAVVINREIIERARAVLPLTQRRDVPPFFGTRHRAAMGLAERSDAIVIAVSEQRGTVTLIEDRKILEMRNSEQMAGMLDRLETRPELSWPVRLRRVFTQNVQFKAAAAGLAAAVWAAAFYTGTTVRTVTVPVAFSGVPPGMNIAAQSVSGLEVQIRGNPLMMDSASLTRLVATFDLHGAPAGQRVVQVLSRDFDLPPGIRFVRASPAVVSVRLVRSGS
jgi:hypothetical protein